MEVLHAEGVETSLPPSDNGRVELPFGIPFIQRVMHRNTYNPRQEIFGDGTPCETFAILVSGGAELARHTVDGRRIAYVRKHAPALFAEGIFLATYPWGVWATAPAVVIRIEMDALPDVFRVTPGLRLKVVTTFVEDFLMAVDRVEDDTLPVPVRLSRHLIRHAVQERDGKPRVKGLTTEEIAQLTSLSRESIIKAGSVLFKRRVISKDRHEWKDGITIENMDQLQEIAEGIKTD